jgi:hypothetical protein
MCKGRGSEVRCYLKASISVQEVRRALHAKEAERTTDSSDLTPSVVMYILSVSISEF